MSQVNLFGKLDRPLVKLSKREEDAQKFLDRVIWRYNPVKVIALFSGGSDSLASTLLASLHDRFDGAAHMNTGLGIKETRRFVRQTCIERDWELLERYPPGKQVHQLVQRYGFPGWPMHGYYYQPLKGHSIDRLVTQLRKTKVARTRPILFVSGARKYESKRRMANSLPITDYGSHVIVNPLLWWEKVETKAYARLREAPQNEVSQHLHFSGECLCGASAGPGELDLIRAFYPGAADEIDWLSGIAKKAGKHHVWGTNPPHVPKEFANQPRMPMPLCTGCETRGAA